MSNDQAAGLASLEAPTMVTIGGAPAVMAIIEHLSASECRMRSVKLFDFGARIEFNAVLSGSQPIPLVGVIASHKQNGARYAYVVGLDTTTEQGEAILRAVAAARSRGPAPVSVPDVPSTNGLTRTSVRIPVDFEVRCTHAAADYAVRATDLSSGGLLMNSNHTFPVGASLELRLPIGNEPVAVHGRVVAHQAASPNYNIAFYDVTHEARERIERYIDSRLVT
ncbi:MAG TPA: PilZ domain-containing protein [Candidatus Baltobacteraceae bacterium]|nr:PilZ domain-containing protein [Candidatus Baltobacteraceae bacterium]